MVDSMALARVRSAQPQLWGNVMLSNQTIDCPTRREQAAHRQALAYFAAEVAIDGVTVQLKPSLIAGESLLLVTGASASLFVSRFQTTAQLALSFAQHLIQYHGQYPSSIPLFLPRDTPRPGPTNFKILQGIKDSRRRAARRYEEIFDLCKRHTIVLG